MFPLEYTHEVPVYKQSIYIVFVNNDGWVTKVKPLPTPIRLYEPVMNLKIVKCQQILRGFSLHNKYSVQFELE